MRKKETIYAIYDAEDNCVCVGDAQECVAYLGVSLHHFYSKMSAKGNRKYKIYSLGKGKENNNDKTRRNESMGH